jgi:hypothetical protein
MSDDLTLGFGLWDAPQEPQVAASQPLPQPSEVSAQVKKEILETIGNNSDIVPIPVSNLNGRQKKNIQLLARGLYMAGELITAQAIFKLWPEGMNYGGSVSKSVTDPDERGRVFRAGYRPSISEIQVFCRTSEYAEGMRTLGIEIDPDDTGLTAEQLGLLTILSNPADGRDLKRKLSHAGITWAKYQVWLEQPVFKEYHSKIVGKALKQAIPMAEQQLAAGMLRGDLAFIKFGMEVSGHHDPNGKKQVDAEALLRILLEVIEENVKDPEVLRKIAAEAQLRGMRAIGG